jgi:hypothetical protein
MLLATCAIQYATAIGSSSAIAGVPGIPQAFVCTAGLAQVSCSFTAPAAPAGGPAAVPVRVHIDLLTGSRSANNIS